MIRDRRAWEEWEKEQQRREAADFHRNLRLVQALYEEAIALGNWKSRSPLEGFEVKLRVAQALNVSTDSRTTGE